MSFKSFLVAVGEDFKKALPWIASIGEAAVSAFLPAMSPLFNQTVNAVITAEQNAAALGTQSGSGPAKLAAVVALMGPLIAQGLKDAGKPNTATDVENYINTIVEVLNTTPTPIATTPAPTA